MSGIAGIVRFDGRGVDPQDLGSMLESMSHRGPDGRGHWYQDQVALGNLLFQTTRWASPGEMPLEGRGGDCVITADARIDNRQDLASALGWQTDRLSEVSDAELILEAYQRWGQDCVSRLEGDFSFGIWDRPRQRILCARDPFGVRGLYYHDGGHLFAFASEVTGLLALREVSTDPDREKIADHLALVILESDRTFYRSIKRLPAGHLLTVDSRGLRLHRYWAFDASQEVRLPSDVEYEEAFLSHFQEAVRRRLEGGFAVGSTLSGGLDSSSITCVAREILRAEGFGPLHTFSAVFPDLPAKELKRADERVYVRAVLDEVDGLIPHEVPVDHLNPLEAMESMIDLLAEPCLAFNMYLHLALFGAAKSAGVRVLLDGFDGDTTVSHGLERITELTRDLKWRTLMQEVRCLSARSPNLAATPRHLLWRYAITAVVPSQLKRFYRWARIPSSTGHESTSMLRDEFAIEAGVLDRIRQLEVEQSRSVRSSREGHLRGLGSPAIQYTLELADTAAAVFGLESRYPFFDSRFASFCLGLPSDQKLRNGWTRSILRRATQGVLPHHVQWRRTKADLSPNFRLGMLRNKTGLFADLIGGVEAQVAEFVDMNELGRVVRRFETEPSNDDGMKLFAVGTLAFWLGSRFGD